MSELTVLEFRGIERHFADQPDLVIQGWIDQASIMSNYYAGLPTEAMQKLAIAYLACHIGTLAGTADIGLAGLPTRYRSQNDEVQTTLNPTNEPFNLELTPCGKKLLMLIKPVIPPFYIAGGCC